MCTTSNMPTLASLSRVPISTSTKGTVKCWAFCKEALVLFRATQGGELTKIDFKKSALVLCLQASGMELYYFSFWSQEIPYIEIPGITSFPIC